MTGPSGEEAGLVNHAGNCQPGADSPYGALTWTKRLPEGSGCLCSEASESSLQPTFPGTEDEWMDSSAESRVESR